ncbi:MAG: cyclic nucleotide-binding domain-containing protein [Deltaproteobacteria bacterium]
MAHGDEDAEKAVDATEAVDVVDVVRELSSLLDVREGHTDEMIAGALTDDTTDESALPDDDGATVGMPAVNLSSGAEPVAEAPSGSGPIAEALSGPSGPITGRPDPTMALQAVHLGEHENTGESDMPDDETVAGAPIDAVPSVGLLARLEVKARKDLFAAGQRRTVDAGTPIANQSSPAGTLVVLVRGAVRALEGDLVVDVLGPGDVVGATMVTDGKYAATYVVVESADVLVVPLDAVKAWAGRYGSGLHWLEQLTQRAARAKILLSAKALRRIPRDVLAQQADECTEQPVGEGDALFREGDPSGPAYVVVEGRFRMSVADASQGSAAPTTGDVLGVTSAVHDRPRGATAVAVTDARVLTIPAGVLRAIAKQTQKPGPASDPPAPAPSEDPTVGQQPVAPSTDPAPPSRPRPKLGAIPPLSDPGPGALLSAQLPPDGALLSWARIGFVAQRARLGLAVLFALVAGLLSVVPGVVVPVLIDGVVVEGTQALLVPVTVALLGATVAFVVASFASHALESRAAAEAAATLEDTLTQALLVARFFQDTSRVAPVLGQSQRVTQLWSAALTVGVGGAVHSLAILAGLAYLDLRFAGLAALMFVAYAATAAVVGRRLARRVDEAEDLADLARHGRQLLLAGREQFAATGRVAHLAFRLEAAREARAKALARAAGLRALGRGLITSIGAVGLVVALGLGARLSGGGAITMGTLVGASALVLLTVVPVLRAFELFVALGYARQMVGVLASSLVGRGGEVPPTADVSSLRGLVRLSRVAAPGLEISELLVRAGEHVAIVGATGSGHDALAAVIAGARPVSTGEVVYDDTPIAALGTAALAQRVAMVGDVPRVFDGTVLENVTLSASPDIERARAIAIAVGLEPVVARFELGFETPLGREGPTMSVADELRIALARALYVDAPVLVVAGTLDTFDDATAEHLAHAIRAVRAGRTTIVATAHAELASMFDRRIDVAEGRVVRT